MATRRARRARSGGRREGRKIRRNVETPEHNLDPEAYFMRTHPVFVVEAPSWLSHDLSEGCESDGNKKSFKSKLPMFLVSVHNIGSGRRGANGILKNVTVLVQINVAVLVQINWRAQMAHDESCGGGGIVGTVSSIACHGSAVGLKNSLDKNSW